jgi:hypothetical protein
VFEKIKLPQHPHADLVLAVHVPAVDRALAAQVEKERVDAHPPAGPPQCGVWLFFDNGADLLTHPILFAGLSCLNGASRSSKLRVDFSGVPAAHA